MDLSDTILRFALTFLMALVFGIERQRSHKPIGFGTFIFVAIGSCALAITAISLSAENPAESPIPLLGAIVTGIGFLGAGALIKTSDRIFGFTTAASIWVFAILGLVIGVGEYLTGFIVYLLVWMVVYYDRALERRGVGSYQKKVAVSANRIMDEREIRKALGAGKCKLISIQADKVNDMLQATYLIAGGREDIDEIPKKLMPLEWFASCRLD
ncbi:MAG: MgtC/SapB family protein [Candidatus Altiarchaeota archaeon]|nr:MgtC/SapB family protein [Candidatus Altiarchaeota archaeon]